MMVKKLAKMRYRKQMLLCVIGILFLAAAPLSMAQTELPQDEAPQAVLSQTVPPAVSAEESFALLPLKGEPEEIVVDFFDVLIRMVPEFSSLPVWIVNLDEPPADVPPGGFPANICPPPSLTGTALYAVTGEVTYDPDLPGNFRMRLYLWSMEEKRLLMSDELTAVDRVICEKQLTHLLPWLLSFAKKKEPIAEKETTVQPAPEAEPEVIIREVEKQIFIEKPLPENWLYIGLRGGGGYSLWYSSFFDMDVDQYRDTTTSFWSGNAAVQVAFHPLRFFEIQTEASFSADLESFDYINFSLTVPLLLKLVFQDHRLRASLYSGVYLFLPVYQIAEDDSRQMFTDYKPGFENLPVGFPGFTFGVSLGWKVGPGYLFMDGRFDYDGHWMSNFQSDGIYYRNLIKVNIGYEWGLIQKKKRNETN